MYFGLNCTYFEVLFWPFLTFLANINICIDMLHPQSFFEWCIKPKIIRKGIMHPILNVLVTIMHMVRTHRSALTDFVNDCFGHFLALFDQFLGQNDQINISRYLLTLV